MVGKHKALPLRVMSLPVSLLIGLALGSFIGLFAYLRGSLTRSGVLGAILTGTAVFGFGGFVPGILLIAFFVSSTLWSKYQARAKENVAEKFQKGSRRDLGQALANGAWAALLAIGYWFAASNSLDERAVHFFFGAFVGAMATVTADTWATEIGVLSKALPRMISTGRVVPAGTSGGITVLGTVTALLGAMFIGAMVNVANALVFVAAQIPILNVAGVFVWGATVSGIGIIFIASISGLAGALFDSLLGATVQAIYFSEYDERQTEKQLDSQGNPTRLIRGWRWLDNDWVNFFASVFGSLVAGVLVFLFL